MMKTTAMITLVLITLLNSKLCWPYDTMYCITPEYYTNESCPQDHHMWLWSDVSENFIEHFVSYREIYFLPGEYRLNNHITIMHVTNLSLIGLGKNSVTFQCASYEGAFVSVYNSTFLKLQNIKLINCGMPINDLAYHNVSISSTKTAALFVYEVVSMAITDVTFENTQGHAIIGVNALKDIVIKNVVIINTLKLQDIAKDNKTCGIVFIYNDDFKLKTKDYPHGILIKNCQFIYLRNVNKPTSLQTLESFDSIVIGLSFHQMDYNVTVTIQDCHIENITSKDLPLISISYKPFSQTTVNFTNTVFTNNIISSVKGYSMFSIQINQYLTSDRFLYILLHNCEFYKNHLSIWNDKINKHKPLKVTLISNKFMNNSAVKNIPRLWILNFRYFAELTIQDCQFVSNANSTFGFRQIKVLRFTGRNIFKYNLAVKQLLCFSTAYPQFKGYYEFSYNVVNSILSVYRYITLLQNTTINIINNEVYSDIYTTKKEDKLHWAPIHVGTRDTLFECSFQFNEEDYETSNIHVSMINNTYYSHAVFGTQMNSCYWHRNDTYTGEAYTNMFLHDSTLEPYVNREGAMLCYCKNGSEMDCFTDHFQSIFPGQVVDISLILLPPIRQTALYIDSSKLLSNSIYSPCKVPSSKIYLISNKCTALSFKINFQSLEKRSCFLNLKTTTTPETVFIYYFDHMKCPLGFQFINGSCDCDPRLKAVFPNLNCDIDKQILTRPPTSWIGITQTATGNNTVYYVDNCVEYFCSWRPSNIQLHLPDTQCVNNRVGIMCGHCPVGLDSVFGSFGCKRCSNYWLFLLPVFVIAGVLLVLSLFLLNITVVHGNINGFIFYVNVLVGHYHTIFPKRSILFVLMSLLNLDLGIETCFYHGMTEYGKTWLQFTFPVYLLLIVASLAFASRYSSSVERLTRRRVIPVIATIFLLSYTKLLLATTKVLFSYKAVHTLDDSHTQIIWMWDSRIPPLGIKFICLFAACLIVFLIVLVPFNFVMLFTKFFYRFRFVVKYIKPFVDACQAPVKDKFRYFFGLELVMRSIYFTLGNRILNIYQTLSLSTLTLTLLLVYLCTFQPFKSTVNNALYISYVINGQFITFILIFNNLKIFKSYNIIFNGLVLIAVLEFAGTILYSFYINHLKRIFKDRKLAEKMIEFIVKCLPVDDNSKNTELNMVQISNEDSLREELLIEE